MHRIHAAYGVAISAALGFAPIAARADGPCTNDIAQLGRQLGTMNGLGAPVSEPDNGQNVGMASTGQMNQPDASGSQKGGTTVVKGGSPGTVGGVSGAVGGGGAGKQADAVATGQVATSSADVRRQSAGKPTMAQQAAQDAGKDTGKDPMDADNKVSQAKAALQRAVDQNAKGDNACMDSIKDVRSLMPQR